MLINRWKKDKDKEKSNASASQNASASGAGGSGSLKSTSGSSIKKKRKSGKEAEEDWNAESKNKASTNDQNARADEDLRKGRSNRREDPRRHTLSGDHHSAATAAAAFNYQNNIALERSLDLEMGMKNQRKKSPSSRGYPPISNSNLFDDDPGIMSEVETSSTGFRRGNKQRSSLPVVRTPSKTLERPLGLVFLQYRNETKRSLLPNEITSLDTVKALFVRSFPKQLTMEYLDSPRVKIYIHDSNKDMFYELEDLRSHLNEIRDRSVLRLFESADTGDGTLPPGLSVPVQMWNDPDQSYFSEPEFDSEFQHQHIHKSKTTKSNLAHQPYYMTHSFPPGSSATLPRSGSLMRPFSPAVPIGATVIPKSAHAGFTSSPERAASARGYSPYARNFLDDPYYSQYSSRASSITPIIDEETSDTELLEDGYGLYSGVKLPGSTAAAAVHRSATFALGSTTPGTVPSDATRLRVEHMERQLANLTGLVQKALTQTGPTSSPGLSSDLGPFAESKPKLNRDKSVSFEKSVSFSDDPPELNSPKQHSPQHTDSKPTKPAIKSSTLPRTSSQERERLKPAPPPKPTSLSTTSATYDGRTFYRDLQLTPELYNQLRGLQKKARDLRHELRNLRRMSQAQAHSVKESVRDTFVKIRSMVLSGGESLWSGGADSERIRITREEEIYKEDINRLEDDLTELESTVEELRSNVINRKTRVNMIDVENMALILSKSSKTVADLKLKFPLLQGAMKSVMSLEMQRVIAEENFLKEEPERLESALRRCKKLTGTLVTLKRLASVQEQRLPDNRASPTSEEPPITPTSGKNDGDGHQMACSGIVSVAGSRGCGGVGAECAAYAANTFDSLLEELQTTGKVEAGSHNGVTSAASNTATLRRLHSFPADAKPPVPERLGDLAAKRVPPPPPPRTSSKSPLASPTNPMAPAPRRSPTRKGSLGSASNGVAHTLVVDENERQQPSPSTSSSCESINSQEGLQHRPTPHLRQEQLEIRHQELLKKQRALQEQYSRLQQLQQTPPPDLLQLKKTGSEGNIFSKMGMTFGPVGVPSASGSASIDSLVNVSRDANAEAKTKVYETDIL